jgi:hypothetical protein
MSTSLPRNFRFEHLDAVRSFALILGVFFHASLSFIPIFIGWAVMDISTSDSVLVFIMIIHSFRMELFFLIAGFFGHMKFHQHGVNAFVKSRLVRIALPLFIGWFLLRPLLISAWFLGAESMRGDVDILNGLLTGFYSLAELPKNFLIGTHLWFLYYILLICLSVILLRYVLSLHEPIYCRLISLLDCIIAWLNRSRLAVYVVVIPTATCLWFMQHWTVDTPDKSLLPNIPVTLLYGGFYIFGWLCHRYSFLLQRFSKITWHKLILCSLAIIVCVFLSSFEMEKGHSCYWIIKASFMLSYSMMMWTLISLSIGICQKMFSRPNKLIRYIADASYWLYIIHLPIVLWLQIAFAELPFHWLIKLVSISTITLLASIFLYDLFIRSTFIGAVLNGKRKPRCFFTLKFYKGINS